MPTKRKCPSCDFETADEKIRFCPEHGAKLEASVVWYDAFISYRRKDCSAHAQLIRSALQSARGMNVFVDVNELRPGPFDEALLGKIEAAPNFILVLSEDSLERCQNEGDWLRREIVHALKHGRHIVPVLLNGAVMPKAETLPADMRDLTRWNAVRYDDTFPEDALRRIGEWCKVERRAELASAQGGLGATTSKPEGDQHAGAGPAGPELTQAAGASRLMVEFVTPTMERATSPSVLTPGQNWTVPGVGIDMLWVAPGSFVMGSPESETGRSADEAQHRVMLTKGFWLGKYSVTQRQWQEVMGTTPSFFRKGRVLKNRGLFTRSVIFQEETQDNPVEGVSWLDALCFCETLNDMAKSTEWPSLGVQYSLPTESQWEYACRAETGGPYSGTRLLDGMGWYSGNSGGRPHPVGQKKPNAWGFYDMHGNVWEWCRDWYLATYPEGLVVDPAGPQAGGLRVYRGGSWNSSGKLCSSAYRGRCEPNIQSGNIGIRLALSSVR